MIAPLTFPRPSPAELEALKEFGTATIHEAMGQKGAMPVTIKPIYPGMKLCGPALTVDSPPGDNLMLHAAIERAAPGDILVVDFKGFLEAGPFGDIMATASQARGIAGLVIDGCVRDGEVLKAMNFPVFSRGLCMKGTTKKLLGTLGRPILCAGVTVRPGDAIIGDDDGIVVVPRDAVAETVQAARRREDKEEQSRQQLRGGASTIDLLGLRDVVDAAGF